MPTPPEGYRFHTSMTIRYGDLDALNHVNNAKYLTYMEQGRIDYYRELGLWDGNTSKVGVIVAKITIEYRLPLSFEDGEVDVWTRCSRLGDKSMDVQSLIVRCDGQIAAAGRSVMVAYDYQAGAAVTIPDGWRERIAGYEPALSG